MQTIEIRQRQEEIAAERLEAATGIAGAVAQHGAAHAISYPRLKLLEAGILASDALAGDQTDARIVHQNRQQLRHEGRVVLAVAIEGGDHRRACMRDAGAYRR